MGFLRSVVLVGLQSTVAGAGDDPHWLVADGLHEGPAAELIAEFLEGTGLEMDGREFARTLTGQVAVISRGSSRLQMIEEVCGQVGLVPVYPVRPPGSSLVPVPAVLRFARGARTGRRVFVGPCLVELVPVTLDERFGQGEIGFRVTGLEHPEFPAHLVGFQDLELVAAGSGEAPGYLSRERFTRSGSTGTGVHVEVVRWELDGIERTVTSIPVVRGTVSWTEPRQEDEVVLRDLTQGASAEGHGLGLEVLSAGLPFEFRVRRDEYADVGILLDALDGSGRGLVGFARRWGIGRGGVLPAGAGDSLETEVSMLHPSAVVAVRLRLVHLQTFVADFGIRDVELPREQDATGADGPLAFPGFATPVEVQVTRRGDAERMPPLDLVVVDHANQDVFRLVVIFHYVDTDGVERGTCRQTLVAGTEEGPAVPLARAGAIGEVSSRAYFLPADAVAVRVEVAEAEFRDGTRWTATEDG